MRKRVLPFLMLGFLIVPKVWADEPKHGSRDSSSQSEIQNQEKQKEAFEKIAADPKSIEELSPEEIEKLKEFAQEKWEEDHNSNEVTTVLGAIAYREFRDGQKEFQVAAAAKAESAMSWARENGEKMNDLARQFLESAKKTAPNSEGWQNMVKDAEERVRAFGAARDFTNDRLDGGSRARSWGGGRKAAAKGQWDRKGFSTLFGDYSGAQWQKDLMGISAGFFRGALQKKVRPND